MTATGRLIDTDQQVPSMILKVPAKCEGHGASHPVERARIDGRRSSRSAKLVKRSEIYFFHKYRERSPPLFRSRGIQIELHLMDGPTSHGRQARCRHYEFTL